MVLYYFFDNWLGSMSSSSTRKIVNIIIIAHDYTTFSSPNSLLKQLRTALRANGM